MRPSDRRATLLRSSNLTGNPFAPLEPDPELLEGAFVGRAHALREAAFLVLDRPRNLFVLGDPGLGKTLFIHKLLRDLELSRTLRFLTGYAPLREGTPRGLQRAALSALTQGVLRSALPHPELSEMAREIREELDAPEDSSLESAQAPAVRFRELLKLSGETYRRVVLGLDESGAWAPRTLLSVVKGARYFLDQEVSFILPGCRAGGDPDVRAPLLADFDHVLELEPLTPEESEELLRRALRLARVEPEKTPSLRPLRSDVVEALLQRARGLPGRLHRMARATLEQALVEGEERGAEHLDVTLGQLERALQREEMGGRDGS